MNKLLTALAVFVLLSLPAYGQERYPQAMQAQAAHHNDVRVDGRKIAIMFEKPLELPELVGVLISLDSNQLSNIQNILGISNEFALTGHQIELLDMVADGRFVTQLDFDTLQTAVNGLETSTGGANLTPSQVASIAAVPGLQSAITALQASPGGTTLTAAQIDAINAVVTGDYALQADFTAATGINVAAWQAALGVTGGGGVMLTQAQTAAIASVIAGDFASAADVTSNDTDIAALQTAATGTATDITDIEVDIQALQNAPAGGLTRTASGGASILHDGTGASPPTFADNGSGGGTLTANGNTILSASGTFSTVGGLYVMTHDVGLPAGGAAYREQDGISPGARNPTVTATTHRWTGLTGNLPHRFIWSF